MNLFGFEFGAPSLPTDPKRAGVALLASSVLAPTLGPLAPLAGLFASNLLFGEEEKKVPPPMVQKNITINKEIDKSRTILGGGGKKPPAKPKASASYTQPLLSLSPRS